MCHNITLVETLYPFSKPFTITLPNCHEISVIQAGTVRLVENILISEVLHDPKFHYNFFVNRETHLAIQWKCYFYSYFLHYIGIFNEEATGS